MHWFSGLLVFLLIAAPWFVLVIKANPEFFQRFFIYEHFTRFTTKVAWRATSPGITSCRPVARHVAVDGADVRYAVANLAQQCAES